jgi:hypothetical protein
MGRGSIERTYLQSVAYQKGKYFLYDQLGSEIGKRPLGSPWNA